MGLVVIGFGVVGLDDVIGFGEMGLEEDDMGLDDDGFCDAGLDDDGLSLDDVGFDVDKSPLFVVLDVSLLAGPRVGGADKFGEYVGYAVDSSSFRRLGRRVGLLVK